MQNPDAYMTSYGLAWQPESGELWTVVNQRDLLGSDLVPDYLTTVKDGGFYGWPYSYFGNHLDPRVKSQRLDLVAKAIVPVFGRLRGTSMALPNRQTNWHFQGTGT